MVVLPAPFSKIPRINLLFEAPTAIEKLERLSTSTPGVALWIKREDCNSGLAMGGNKCRKLEYVLPDAISNGADTLVTVGGIQSNHMRQVAAAAARYGLRVSQHIWSEGREYREITFTDGPDTDGSGQQ
jgi:1-aminocyclopropane-1-carboxylate deaminase